MRKTFDRFVYQKYAVVEPVRLINDRGELKLYFL